MTQPRFICWFREIGITDVPLVGGKNVSLGAMSRELVAKGIRIPNRFAVTAGGYRYLLQVSGLAQKIRSILSDLDTRDRTNLAERGRCVRTALLRGERASLDACQQCLASLFTDRAISCRVDEDFDHFAMALSIGVQQMVRSDLGAALRTPPADLTLLTHRNNGVFPEAKVSEFIDGTREVAAHGPRTMPVWGLIFQSRETIRKIVEYIRELQRT